jgi:hypothetical protein
MEQHQPLNNKIKDGNGINESLVGLICVYAGSSLMLSSSKANFVE